MTNNHHNLIIVGSGPAGHTASIYAAKALLNPLMFEGYMAGGMAAGGQLLMTTIVENFPGFPNGISGANLMSSMRQQNLNAGGEIITKTVDSVDLSQRPFKVFVGDEIYTTDALIIATGANAKRMNLPGEPRYRQRGVSACAICDGGLPLFRNKRILVIGGGNTALEEALYLTHFASEVLLIVRRNVFRASKIMQEKVYNNEKIKICWNTEILELLGDNNILNSVLAINNQTKEQFYIECSGVFYAIGHQPNTEFLGGQLTLDEDGYIITEPGTTKTSVEGVFAAGDVQDKKYRQAITSAGTGCMAALEAELFLQNLGKVKE